MKGVLTPLRSPYSDGPSPCVVILVSHLSTVPFRFQGKSEISGRKLLHNQWVGMPLGGGQAKELHAEPSGACHLSLASVPHNAVQFSSGLSLTMLDSPRGL